MPFLRDEQGRLIRKDGSLVENAQRGRKRGPRKTVVGESGRISHLRVDAILGGEGPLRDEYERLVGNPNTYLKHLHAWFRERGHHVTLSAIRRHRDRHLARYRSVRETTEFAEAYCRATGRHGQAAVVRASQARAEMLLMQDMFKLKEHGGLPPETWGAWARAVHKLVVARQTMEAAVAVLEQNARRPDGAAESAENGRRVAERVREILGV